MSSPSICNQKPKSSLLNGFRFNLVWEDLKSGHANLIMIIADSDEQLLFYMKTDSWYTQSWGGSVSIVSDFRLEDQLDPRQR
jgi:hypothetical protein